MAYNKDELLALPAEEKITLAEELWSSVENELLPITYDDISFAEERLKMYQDNPDEGLNLEEFKNHFSKKYGF